jgi:hypothetical protein
MKKNIICLILSILMFSCNKKDELTITVAEGYIYHSGTKKPLEGVKVLICDGLPYSHNGSNRRDSILTDVAGFFHVILQAEEPVLYLYKKDFTFEYEVEGAVIGIVPLNIGNNLNLRFELDAWAYFRPKCYYAIFLEDQDTSYFSDYCANFISTEFKIGKGPHILYSDDYSWDKGRLAKGDKFFHYWLKYQLNRIWNIKEDSVYITSFTTYSDTIYY